MTSPHATPPAALNLPVTGIAAPAALPIKRISSSALMDGRREVEIEHSGKIYRLRITQLNKLILTA